MQMGAVPNKLSLRNSTLADDHTMILHGSVQVHQPRALTRSIDVRIQLDTYSELDYQAATPTGPSSARYKSVSAQEDKAFRISRTDVHHQPNSAHMSSTSRSCTACAARGMSDMGAR